MLINTVILFVKDVLPVFILLSFVAMLYRPQIVTRRHVVWLLIFTFVGILLLTQHIEFISEFYEGGGVELLYTAIDVAVYVVLLMLSFKFVAGRVISSLQTKALILSASCFAAVNLSEFFLFFSTLLVSKQTVVSTLVGASFGLGICASFTALFALLLNSLRRNHPMLFLAVWAFYLAGFLAQTLYQLQQIDVINSGQVLWNSGHLVADSSEYGYLLKALFGYVSAPTIEYAVVYLISLVIFVGTVFTQHRASATNLTGEGGIR